MKYLPSLIAAFMVLLFTSLPAFAAVEHYSFDKPHTQIIFSVGHMGYSHSFGKFTDYSGGFDFDRENPEKSSVEINIPTASLSLEDKAWNEHVSGEDFFNVAKFPAMTFKSTAIHKTGDNAADITGDLTLLGVTKPVVLHTVFNKADRNPFGKYVAGFSATADIRRSDFGMGKYVPMVSDEVHIIIEVEGVRADPEGKEQYQQ